MKAETGVLGLLAACAACCAVPIALPFVLGTAGFVTAALGWKELALGFISIALLTLLVSGLRRRSCSPDSCAIPPRGSS